MNITLIKKLPGIPADQVSVKEIIDEKIISKAYAMRIADYVLDAYGRKWWRMQGTMAATEMLYKDDSVEFWSDGVRYEGLLLDHPDLKGSFGQGTASLIFNIEGIFLKNES